MEFSFIVILLYFVPSIIVVLRKSHNVGPVIVINLFLGWTFIGWIVALAMSVATNKNKKKNVLISNWSPPNV